MNTATALARLRALRVPVIRTADAVVALGQSQTTASQTLVRLARAGLVKAIRHGLYGLDDVVDALLLPEHLTAPLPSYVSLQTALHLHGLVEQIPEVVYAVSLARSQRVVTTVGTFSIHRLAPEIFGGFAETPSGVKLAEPEKALFDFAYLSGGRSRLFTSLPELELPKRFRRKELAGWVARIPSARGRTLTSQKLDALLARARPR